LPQALKIYPKDFAPKFDSTEFQKTYLFRILIPLSGDLVVQDYEKTIVAPEMLQYCTSATAFPTSKTDIQTIAYYNSELKVAKKTTYDPWEVTFRYDISKEESSYSYFDWWKNAIYGEKSRVGQIPDGPNGYKKDIMLFLLDENGKNHHSFKLEGAWPSALTGGNLAYSEDSLVTFSVAFAYDRYIYDRAYVYNF
jgi:hypothetical protein